MERSTERALKRAGHATRLFDDKRSKQLFGAGLTQRRALSVARSFKPVFVLLGKCQSLALETVNEIIPANPNRMWTQAPPPSRNVNRPDFAPSPKSARWSRTLFALRF